MPLKLLWRITALLRTKTLPCCIQRSWGFLTHSVHREITELNSWSWVKTEQRPVSESNSFCFSVGKQVFGSPCRSVRLFNCCVSVELAAVLQATGWLHFCVPGWSWGSPRAARGNWGTHGAGGTTAVLPLDFGNPCALLAGWTPAVLQCSLWILGIPMLSLQGRPLPGYFVPTLLSHSCPWDQPLVNLSADQNLCVQLAKAFFGRIYLYPSPLFSSNS